MITPIRLNSIILHKQNRTNPVQPKQNISFSARPEYDVFINRFSAFKRSYFFRRAQELDGFRDIVDALKIVSSKFEKPKLLIVGLADAQEPFSFLAVIKSLNKKSP